MDEKKDLQKLCDSLGLEGEIGHMWRCFGKNPGFFWCFRKNANDYNIVVLGTNFETSLKSLNEMADRAMEFKK